MKKLTFLTDYRDRFGSKFDAVPYRGGLDKGSLKSLFSDKGIDIEFIHYNAVDFRNPDMSGKLFIHDSIEDIDYLYKDYMEDIIYALELKGASIVPGYKFIRAHNNKVFMELLRDTVDMQGIKTLATSHFGCLEEFEQNNKEYIFPVVIKGAQNAQGRQVKLGTSYDNAIKAIKSVSSSKHLSDSFREKIRILKYPAYIKESDYRKKFILMEFVPDLKNDWKVLIFNEKYFILCRGVKEGDFRASGSKSKYGFGSLSEPQTGIFDYAKNIYDIFDVPYISLDIAFDGKQFHLLEFQFVSFGSSTQLKSDCYFINNNGVWESVFQKLVLEKLYVDSLHAYLVKKKYL